MQNHLIRIGQMWPVKGAIPADVQHIIGKRAFKKSLQTADKTVASVRSVLLIAKFKDDIPQARGTPMQHLDYDCLKKVHLQLSAARSNTNTDSDALAGIE